MIETLLSILEQSLRLAVSMEGKSLYKEYLKNKRAHDEEMDKASKGLRYSQLKCDRCMRNIHDIAKAQYEYLANAKK